MTKNRPWPNNAKDARDDAAAEACKTVKILSPILEREMTREELYRRIGIAINSNQYIARLLMEVGAQIRTEQLEKRTNENGKPK
jgi:DNA-binding Xre family transcriptional regulator